MKKSFRFTFRTFVFLAILLSGCVPTSTETSTETPDVSNQITEIPTEAPGVNNQIDDREPKSVKISSDGSGDFATIEEAIEAIPPNSTIVLGEGQFELSEPLVIEKSLTIQGAGSTLTTILMSSGGSPVILFKGKQLTIMDISIQRTGEFASSILTINGDVAYLENCNLSGGTASEANSIHGVGLTIRNNADVTMKNCVIENNMGDGIFVGDNAKLTVEQITSSNTLYGIVYAGNSIGNIQNSTFSDNRASGILVAGSAQVNIVGNTINNNVGPGITFQMDATNGEVRNNNLARNDLNKAGTDIMIYDAYAPALIGNTCDGEGESIFGGDLNGIVFWGLNKSLPTNPTLEENSCMIAMCTSPPDDLFSVRCK